MRVYLAGPITGLTFGAAIAWRVEAATVLEKNGHEVLSPMRGKDFILKRIGEAEVLGQTYEDAPLASQRGIVARDHFDVSRADVVLFNLCGAERVSIGTMIEYGWASAFRKVIITAMGRANVHNHAFVRELSPYLVPTLPEALEVILAIGRTGHHGE